MFHGMDIRAQRVEVILGGVSVGGFRLVDRGNGDFDAYPYGAARHEISQALTEVVERRRDAHAILTTAEIVEG